MPEQKMFENGRDWATEFAHFLLTTMRMTSTGAGAK